MNIQLRVKSWGEFEGWHALNEFSCNSFNVILLPNRVFYDLPFELQLYRNDDYLTSTMDNVTMDSTQALKSYFKHSLRWSSI